MILAVSPAANSVVQGDDELHPRLVACMLASVAVGGCFAATALAFGLGPLAALACYSLSGSSSLVLFATLAASWPSGGAPVLAAPACA